jgi:colicin import membrane protein
VTTLDRITTHHDFFSRAIWVSLLVHFLLLVSVTLKNVFFKGEPLVYENAIKVDLVALPDKVAPAEAAAAPTPVAPTVAPPEPAKTPPPVKAKDTVNLDKANKK